MKRWFALLFTLVLTLPAYAHIGSKDVYEEVDAGPYKLYVTIRPPNHVPGAAANARSAPWCYGPIPSPSPKGSTR